MGETGTGSYLEVFTLFIFLSLSMFSMTTSLRGTAWFANRISIFFVACIGSRSFKMSFARARSLIGVR